MVNFIINKCKYINKQINDPFGSVFSGAPCLIQFFFLCKAYLIFIPFNHILKQEEAQRELEKEKVADGW
jgi:hypothetical protein